jgi:hypothetical protein
MLIPAAEMTGGHMRAAHHAIWRYAAPRRLSLTGPLHEVDTVPATANQVAWLNSSASVETNRCPNLREHRNRASRIQKLAARLEILRNENL